MLPKIIKAKEICIGVTPASGLVFLSTKNKLTISGAAISKNSLILRHCAQARGRLFRILLRFMNINSTLYCGHDLSTLKLASTTEGIFKMGNCFMNKLQGSIFQSLINAIQYLENQGHERGVRICIHQPF